MRFEGETVARARRIGEGSDELDDGTRAGFDNDFTKRNLTFMTWNLMLMAKMLAERGGFPRGGNSVLQWNDGARFDHPNPEYR